MLFFENLNRDFGTLGIGIVQIGLQIRTCRPRIRLYANFGKFGCITSPKNNQLACFFIVTLYKTEIWQYGKLFTRSKCDKFSLVSQKIQLSMNLTNTIVLKKPYKFLMSIFIKISRNFQYFKRRQNIEINSQ